MSRLGVIVVLVGVVLMCTYAQELYTDKYDNIDVLVILNNDRLRLQYYKCFMSLEPCATGDAKFFKGTYIYVYIYIYIYIRYISKIKNKWKIIYIWYMHIVSYVFMILIWSDNDGHISVIMAWPWWILHDSSTIADCVYIFKACQDMCILFIILSIIAEIKKKFKLRIVYLSRK